MDQILPRRLRLAARKPRLTVAEAAQELRVAPNTVSTLIGRLADRGLLKRVPSSTDGRLVLLEVTAKARRRLAEWRDLRAELAGRALAGLPSQDRAALTAAVPAMLLTCSQRVAIAGASRATTPAKASEIPLRMVNDQRRWW